MATKKTAAAKPAAETKPMTPAEAIAAATSRARVWATPEKKAPAKPTDAEEEG